MTRYNKNERKEEKREPKAPAYIVYAVTEKGEDKTFWTRIGAAFEHKDGEGLSLDLELIPVGGGRIVLRTPKDETNDQGKGA